MKQKEKTYGLHKFVIRLLVILSIPTMFFAIGLLVATEGTLLNSYVLITILLYLSTIFGLFFLRSWGRLSYILFMLWMFIQLLGMRWNDISTSGALWWELGSFLQYDFFGWDTALLILFLLYLYCTPAKHLFQRVTFKYNQT